MSASNRVPCRAIFHLGSIVATLGALAATTDEQRLRYLARHSIGDWCSGAQSKCGGRAIEGGFRRRFAETEGALWRTLFETERTLFETDARSKISTHDN